MNLQERIVRYSKVGLVAATVHFCVQSGLLFLMPIWISNTLGFLAASSVSYFGHSVYTYRIETRGKIFPKRWLILQFIVNIAMSSLLPFFLPSFFAVGYIKRGILVLIPILMNALIWTSAANFSRRYP